MSRVYCHGNLVATRIVDDWFVCTGCGHDLWPVTATFEVDKNGLPSVHGDEREDEPQEAAERGSGGAVQA